MADADDRQMGAQVWGAAVVVGSALAVVAAYLINGALLVLGVAGAETLLLMVYVARRWRALHGGPAAVRHRPRRGIPDAAHCERCRRAREALDARQARAGGARWGEAGARWPGFERRRPGVGALPAPAPGSSGGSYRPSSAPHHPGHGDQQPGHGEQHHAHGLLQEPGPQPESGGGDHPAYPRRPQLRAPYERPWTAERAAARPVDRSTARRGAPGSAGRAVRHQ
ncbi:hypothetical protein [Kitasatospora sp. NPDC018619]|uniref:hypothetical protein n=1 Tax=unclassified Kitasatospora TaxID=2633591 RepID=UPI0037A3CAD0